MSAVNPNVGYGHKTTNAVLDVLFEIAENLNGGKAPSRILRVSDQITRPGDITAYAAGDVVTEAPARVWNFPSLVPAVGNAGRIIGADMWTDPNTALGDFSLYLFKTDVGSANDNSVMNNDATDFAQFVGRIDFLAANGKINGANTLQAYVGSFGPLNELAFVCEGADVDLYGVLVANGAYTPTSEQTFKISLSIRI